jgi:YfiH family protein
MFVFHFPAFHLQSAVRNPQSAILFQSAVRNPQSAILFQSAVRNPQSAITDMPDSPIFTLNPGPALSHLTFAPLSAIPFVTHALTTREHNFAAHGITMTELDVAVRTLQSMTIVLPRQQHGNKVITINRYHLPYTLQCDALVTRLPGRPIAIQVADCVPVFLAETKQRAVALAHAGWRGVVGQIVPATVAELVRVAGGSLQDVTAVIGPCIGPCSFEVKNDMAGQFNSKYVRATPEGTLFVDLPQCLADQLRDAGVPEANIHLSGLCTVCRPDLFYSCRRDGGKGRMLAMMMVKTG